MQHSAKRPERWPCPDPRLGAKVLFRELDANSDGDITAQEWAAWFERLEGRGGSAESMVERKAKRRDMGLNTGEGPREIDELDDQVLFA